MAVADRRVYLSAGAQLVILDDSEPLALGAVGASPCLVSSIENIRVVDDLVYAALGTGGVRIIDVSDPTGPVLRGSFHGDWIHDVSGTANPHQIVAAGTGLYVLDVSDADAPHLLGAYEPDPSNVSYFAVSVVGELAYAIYFEGYRSMQFFGLHVLDVSDPAAINLIGSVGTGPPNGLSVLGDRAYVAGGVRGLDIVDVGEPATPLVLGKYDGMAGDVVVIDSLAYVAAWGDGLRIIDVSDPAAPGLLGSVDTPGQARGICVAGDRVYVADGERGLQVIDVSDPTAPVLLGGYDTGWRRR